MTKINRSEIEEIFEGCPYCGSPGSVENYRGCCGEVHFTQLVSTKDEVLELEEVEIVEDECEACESPDIMRTGNKPESYFCNDCKHDWKVAA